MPWWTAVLVLWLMGCNHVLGLGDTQLQDASPGDPTADALPATCTLTPPLDPHKSTYLLDATPRGDDPELVTGPAQPGLFVYGIDGLLDGGKHIAAAVLHVTPITKCGAACTPCPTGATRYQLYWNDEDWSETYANRTHSDDNSTWELPLAEGAADRSAQLAEAPLPTAGPQLALRAGMTDVARVPAAAWIATVSSAPTTRISLQLRTDAPAAFASDDHDDSVCGETAAPPSLVLTICE